MNKFNFLISILVDVLDDILLNVLILNSSTVTNPSKQSPAEINRLDIYVD